MKKFIALGILSRLFWVSQYMVEENLWIFPYHEHMNYLSVSSKLLLKQKLLWEKFVLAERWENWATVKWFYHLQPYATLIEFFYSPESQSITKDDERYQEQCPNLIHVVSRKIDKACSASGLRRKLPIIEWLPNYQKSYFLQDFVAGLSVGLTAIPQGIGREKL